MTAVYLKNKSKTKALEQRAPPVELWYGVQPDVSKLRIFGCKAYSWIPLQKRRHKLDSKSEKCIMVGYAPNGYRLWNIMKQKIITSRDVKFDEESFP